MTARKRSALEGLNAAVVEIGFGGRTARAWRAYRRALRAVIREEREKAINSVRLKDRTQP